MKYLKKYKLFENKAEQYIVVYKEEEKKDRIYYIFTDTIDIKFVYINFGKTPGNVRVANFGENCTTYTLMDGEFMSLNNITQISFRDWEKCSTITAEDLYHQYTKESEDLYFSKEEGDLMMNNKFKKFFKDIPEIKIKDNTNKFNI